MIAHATLSWLAPRKVRQIEIIGRTALPSSTLWPRTSPSTRAVTYKLGIERNNTIRTELVHFLQSIGDPFAETRNSGVIGVKTVVMLEKSLESLREGRTVATNVRAGQHGPLRSHAGHQRVPARSPGP